MRNKSLSKFLSQFWHFSAVLMKFLVIFCLFSVVNVACVKNLPRSYLPGEDNKHVDGQNNEEYSPMRQADCSVHNSQFLCKDNQRCINISVTCDDKCDCFDCSDESDLCWEYNETLCQSCDHLCFPSPHGSMCLSNNNTHKVIPLECGPDAVCHQKCVMYEGIERCSCRENYRGKPGTKGQECISDVSYDNLLLYSTDNQIKVFNFTANETRVIRDDVKCLSLAAAGDYFYYGTAENDKSYVHKTSMVTGETDLIIDTYNGSTDIYSIDIDWVTGNIYFSTDRCVGVCSKEEEFCARVISLATVDVCHIGLAPRSGLLFTSVTAIWPRYIESRIEKSSMDGSGERLLYRDRGNMYHPISVTVDELSERVFWMDFHVDVGSIIHCIQFDGKNLKKFRLQFHVFAISQFEGNLFWTEENKTTIATNLKKQTNLIIEKNTTSVKYLYAFNPLLKRNKISNPCTNSSCKGLCLLLPSSDKGFLNFRCLCDNMTSSTRKQWCVNPFIPHGVESNEDGDYGDQTESDEKQDLKTIYSSEPPQTEEGSKKYPSEPSQTEKYAKEDDRTSPPPQSESIIFTPWNVILIIIISIALISVLIYFIYQKKGFSRNHRYSQISYKASTRDVQVKRL